MVVTFIAMTHILKRQLTPIVLVVLVASGTQQGSIN